MVYQKMTKNGLLSYENPNYHLDPARLDAAIYGELYDAVSRPRRIIQADNQLDLETEDGDSKDVDGYDDDLEDDYSDNRRRECMEDDEPMLMKTNPINLSDKEALLTPPGLQGPGDESPPPEKERADQRATEKRGPACVPHVARGPNNDLYAVPVKLRPRKDADTEKVDADARDLPPGWEKHEDNDGPYYWHIKSGTIQREMPEMPPQEVAAKDNSKKQMVKEPSNLSEIGKFESGNNAMTSSVTRSTTSCCLDADADVDRKRKEELAFKRRSYPAKPEPDCGRAVRFFVRSLGWVEIAESDLTPERSSRAVNKCIVDLSLGRNDLLDVVGRWGDGKDLFMDLDEGALKLMDPENLTTLHTQPIHTIRVWGVGRDNGRDFAYVARDRATRRHMCHVFRCDMPARTIANTLRDICKRIMIERSLAQAAPASRPARPTDLPTRQRHTHVQSFPTPMEEPRKVVRAQYLGSASVCRATGMDVLNAAIARLASPSPGETPQRRHVSVAVAPSMISITPEGDMNPSVECRVRYLSFLGIGRDVRHCAFIMHTAQDQFVAHVFQCEPSSGALCKTIEAACKLRYQKCLDAHPGSTLNGGLTAGSTTTVSQGSSAGLGSGGSGELRSPGGSTRVGIGATLKSFVGSLAAAASRRPS